MPDPMWKTMVAVLEEVRGIEFADGLTDAEVERVQGTFGFTFPPDLRDFLQTALPVSEGFPDWRERPEDELREWLEIPLRGILFDIDHGGFWLPEWGEQPGDPEATKEAVREMVAAAPVLIPIYQHRMIADRPCEPGNPIFSVHQTDIIYYGVDLRDYLIHEFMTRGVACWPVPESVRRIEFWDINRFYDVRWGYSS